MRLDESGTHGTTPVLAIACAQVRTYDKCFQDAVECGAQNRPPRSSDQQQPAAAAAAPARAQQDKQKAKAHGRGHNSVPDGPASAAMASSVPPAAGPTSVTPSLVPGDEAGGPANAAAATAPRKPPVSAVDKVAPRERGKVSSCFWLVNPVVNGSGTAAGVQEQGHS